MVATVASVVSAVLFLLLVALLGRRSVEAQMRPAWNLFRTFWAAAAVVVAADPVLLMAHQAGMVSVPVYQLGRAVELMGATVAVWALLCYLVYAYKGSRRWWPAITTAYGVVAALLLLMVASDAPERLVVVGDEVEGVPDSRPAWVGAVLVAGLLLPQVAAAVAYLRLVRVVPDRTGRYRVLLVGTGLVLWLGAHLVLGSLRVEGEWWDFVLATLGLVAPVLVLLAYFPPHFVRRRWGIGTLRGTSTTAG